MISKTQALTAPVFHYGECKCEVGPKHGVTFTAFIVRRSGQTQTWKKSPERFRVPVKYGLYKSMYITEQNAADFHVPSECPEQKKAEGLFADRLTRGVKA